MRFRTKIGIFLGLLLIGGTVWFLSSGRTEGSFTRVAPEEAKRAAEILSQDRDNDGLKDWEEELWHTDPLVTDTDGDGTGDGEEIKQGRNPLKAAPGDTLDQKTVEARTVPGGGDWTETDRLSRELFAKYLAIKQSGQEFTAAEEERLLQDFISRYPEQKPKKAYTAEDIEFVAADTGESRRAYGNALGSEITAHTDTGESELVIFETALENDDEAYLATLEQRVKRYETLLSSFRTIPVPKSAQSYHLNILNALSALKESVSGMALAFTDPVHALSAAASYPRGIDELFSAFEQISVYFKQNNIAFASDEPGYLLTK